jgi:signal transduction histidine kinase
VNRRSGIAARLLAAQIIVLAVAGATMLVTVLLVAPGLFRYHLQHTGEDSPVVQQHAQEAFELSFAIAVSVAGAAALATAGILLWLLTRRISRPIEGLADAAATIAAGRYDVTVPTDGYGRELSTLAGSFQDMAHRLASAEAARTRLLADLAHEIRTPLATLAAHIDGLEDGIVPADPETYTAMRAQVDRLRRLASDIKLAAAAQEHALNLRPAPQQPGALLTAACEAAAPRYTAKGVALQCLPCPSTLEVLVDADRVGQVLANLLDNALRHTPPGGAVRLACTPAPDGQIEITVTDTGEGIPTDQLPLIFERFHRVDGSRGTADGSGSGLGLTIARAIAADHGGSLTAASDGPGRGTTMTLRLPIVPRRTPEPADPPRALGAGSVGGRPR